MIYLSPEEKEKIAIVNSSFVSPVFARCYDQIKIIYKDGKVRTFKFDRIYTSRSDAYSSSDHYENAVDYLEEFLKNK